MISYQLSQEMELSSSPSSIITTSSHFSRKAIPVHPVLPNCRRVHFCEKRNETYESPHSNGKVDCRALWYKAEDFQAFKKLNVKYARFLLAREKELSQKSWFDVLRKEYQQCCEAMTLEDLTSLCDTSIANRGFLPGYVGMNPLMIASIHKDRQRRRAQLYDVVQNSQQNYTDLNDLQRAERIGHVCREISRPSRLFAFHTARLHFSAAQA